MDALLRINWFGWGVRYMSLYKSNRRSRSLHVRVQWRLALAPGFRFCRFHLPQGRSPFQLLLERRRPGVGCRCWPDSDWLEASGPGTAQAGPNSHACSRLRHWQDGERQKAGALPFPAFPNRHLRGACSPRARPSSFRGARSPTGGFFPFQVNFYST